MKIKVAKNHQNDTCRKRARCFSASTFRRRSMVAWVVYLVTAYFCLHILFDHTIKRIPNKSMTWVDQIRDEIKRDSLDARDHAGLVIWMLQYITDRYPNDSDDEVDIKISRMFNHLCKQNIPIENMLDEFTVKYVLRAIRLVMHNCRCCPSETRNQ